MTSLNNESECEEMEVAESEKSSSDDSISGTSDDETSSETEEGDADMERRRTEYTEQMSGLEEEFYQLREELCNERLSQIEMRLRLIEEGSAPEYLQRVEAQKQILKNRLEVADILRDLRKANVQHCKDAEIQAAKQDFENQKALAWDVIKMDLEEKIHRLEEDRNNVDITSDLWNEQVNHRKDKKKTDTISSGKRRKPVTVTWPYIVYMLPENDILEDWTTIRKALKAQKQSSEYEFSGAGEQSVRFADGKLLFKGESFRKGEAVIMDDRVDSAWPAHVISVNTSEVLVQTSDGSYMRIGISDLQSGRYGMRHDR